MPTALPASSAFTGPTVQEGDFKAAITALHDFIAGLFGTDGTQATALTTLGALLNGVLTKSAAYPVVAADRGKLIDCTTGTWALSLTAGATLGPGFAFAVKNSGAGVITLDPNGAELIDGVATITVGPGESCFVIWDGAAWKSVGKSSGGGGLTTQTFNSSGTWPKPSAGTTALVECWGAGGGGYNANRCGGGGGGGYAYRLVPLASLGATETVTVAGTTAVNSAGGSSSFGSWSTATGGNAGNSTPDGGWAAGGGGNTLIAYGGGLGGPGSTAGNGSSGTASIWGGGGGGGAGSVNGAGGVSTYAGSGGAANVAGTAPGGGGGGGGPSGTGGAGRVKITVW